MSKFSFDDIFCSNDIKINDYKPNQKILKLLVEATKKAKDERYEIVTVKGSFTNQEFKTMKFYMKGKGYDIWKSKDGYGFTPLKRDNNWFGGLDTYLGNNANSGFNWTNPNSGGGFGFNPNSGGGFNPNSGGGFGMFSNVKKNLI